ncbi:MAG: hypothetical protein QXR18_06980 [Pyrobaculum sp.]
MSLKTRRVEDMEKALAKKASTSVKNAPKPLGSLTLCLSTTSL